MYRASSCVLAWTFSFWDVAKLHVHPACVHLKGFVPAGEWAEAIWVRSWWCFEYANSQCGHYANKRHGLAVNLLFRHAQGTNLPRTRAGPREVSHVDSDAEPSRTASHTHHANTGTPFLPLAGASSHVQRGEMREYNSLRIRHRRVVSKPRISFNQRYLDTQENEALTSPVCDSSCSRSFAGFENDFSQSSLGQRYFFGRIGFLPFLSTTIVTSSSISTYASS